MNSWSTGKPFCVIYAMVDIVFKTHRMGTTLVVQWLRFYIATAKGQGSISGQGNLIPHVATKTLCNEIHTHTHTHTHTHIYRQTYIYTQPSVGLSRWLRRSGVHLQCKRPGFNPWVRKSPWRRFEMATHSSILAWELPWTEEPDTLQSMGLQKSQTGLSN